MIQSLRTDLAWYTERRVGIGNFDTLLVGWKLLTDSILKNDSVEKTIFLQELQKRRNLKAKANILRQDSTRSVGRRAG